jgi:hypothetical protein
MNLKVPESADVLIKRITPLSFSYRSDLDSLRMQLDGLERQLSRFSADLGALVEQARVGNNDCVAVVEEVERELGPLFTQRKEAAETQQGRAGSVLSGESPELSMQVGDRASWIRELGAQGRNISVLAKAIADVKDLRTVPESANGKLNRIWLPLRDITRQIGTLKHALEDLAAYAEYEDAARK